MTHIEPEPAAAEELFGNQLPLARTYVSQLAAHGETLGLIGPLELPRVWTRHVINCGLLAPLFTSGSRVGDVGSGAGLPGLVLALSRPDVDFVLIEPMERRADWLHKQVDVLGLANAEILRARAEECTGLNLDAVTARAVSALRTLIPLTAPLAKPGGELILMKGASATKEISAAAKQIARFALKNVRVQELGGGDVGEATWVVRAKVDGLAR
ncbi:MAG: 16S rRNA (guanine(527)-N(7))-methyltransferase RsmG [Microbacteriaceae bacterium]|nr:16S rRNA (guanine(527)-N(7))-methyltransferase RsmG [Microbacteriaceae bacterium]